MMDDRPGSAPSVFFTQERGGTWVNWDNWMFLWIGDHLILLGCGVALLTGLVGYWYMRHRRARYMRLRGSDKVQQDIDEEQVEFET
jgi:hypothetical protein